MSATHNSQMFWYINFNSQLCCVVGVTQDIIHKSILGAKNFSTKIPGDLVMACHIPCTS